MAVPIQLLDNEANRLIAEQPSSEELIEEKQTEMHENWTQLTERANERKNNLLQSRELQRFLADLRDLVRLVSKGLCVFSYVLRSIFIQREY